jgi:hypothetical protein
VPRNSVGHLGIGRRALERRGFRALGELALSLGRKRGRKVQIQGTLQGVLAFVRLFELLVGRSEVVEELGIVLAFRSGELQELGGLGIHSTPIVEDAQRLGDFRIIRIGFTGFGG